MVAKARTGASTSGSTSTKASSNDAQDIVLGVWNNYLKKTPSRVKLVDSFLGFLIVVGLLQFVYCVIVGNFVSTKLYTKHSQFTIHHPKHTHPIPKPLRNSTSIRTPPLPPHYHFLQPKPQNLQPTNHPTSPSTPSSPASAQPSANSSSPPPSASKLIRKTSRNSQASLLNAPLPISCSARYCCISSA